MKNILITGGTGFLGSHLCEKFLLEGNKVYCIDNQYSSDLSNIERFLGDQNFKFIKHNIIDPLPFDMDTKIDKIYNFACPASPTRYQKDPVYTFKTSVFGAYNAIDFAKNHNATIVHASTSEIYGEPLQHPQKESYFGNVNPIGIRSCYDEGKRAAETLLFDEARTSNLKIKIVRIFNTYGPSMDPKDGRVVSNFINQAINNQDITIYGDGTQTRSFCYVDDLIDIITKFGESDDDFQGPINCGNPTEFKIKELADKIIKLTNSESKIVNMPLPQDDPTQRRPDITLAKEKYNWEPKIDLDDGLKKTILYFHNLKMNSKIF